jgi:hypothetical protein
MARWMGFVQSDEGKTYALAADLLNERPHELFNMSPVEVALAARMQAKLYEMRQPKQTGGNKL